MLSASRDALLKLSKTTSPQKLFDYDCMTLYNKSVCEILVGLLARYAGRTPLHPLPITIHS